MRNIWNKERRREREREKERETETDGKEKENSGGNKWRVRESETNMKELKKGQRDRKNGREFIIKSQRE